MTRSPSISENQTASSNLPHNNFSFPCCEVEEKIFNTWNESYGCKAKAHIPEIT
jgi:hypothetical protein